MPGATTSTASQALRSIILGDIEETVFRNKHFLKLFRQVPAIGDTGYRWNANTAGNTAVETFVEGQAAPSAGKQTYVQAMVGYLHFRAVLNWTGHLRAALANVEGRYFQAIDEEIRSGQQDLADLMETTFMGTGSAGLQLAVDSSGTYAGINRATETTWQSQEDAIGGALSIANLEDLEEELRDSERGANPDLVISRQNQFTNYQRTIGPAAASGGVFRIQMDAAAAGTKADLGLVASEGSFAGKRWVCVPDLTNTIVVMLDSRYWVLAVHEDFDVQDKASADDSVTRHITWRGALVCRNPRRQGKLTGLTP